MKKLLYGILFVASILCIVLAFFLPVYKFEDNKIDKNYQEYAIMISDSSFESLRANSTYNQLSAAEKKAYKKSYYAMMNAMQAVINNDEKEYYNAFKYLILNYIYTELHPSAEEPLSASSTKDEIATVEKMIKVECEDNNISFNDRKNYYVNVELKSNQETIYKAILDAYSEDYSTMTTDEMKDAAIKHVREDNKYLVLNDYFLLFVDSDTELTLLTIDDINKNGLKLTSLFTTWKYAIQIDKQVLAKPEYANMDILEKIKAVQVDDDFYNPLPLLLLSFIFFMIELSFLLMIFKSIKGMRGINKPRTFINCIVHSAICIALIIAPPLIPTSFMNSYHSVEMTRLLDLFRFGNFSILMYIYAIVFLYGIVVSCLCVFGWGKKEKNE